MLRSVIITVSCFFIILTSSKFSAPSLKYDGRWYWYYNSGLQPQSGRLRHHEHVGCQISSFAVICRSKDANLPDGSGEKGPGGEVYFDVSRNARLL